MIDFLAYSIFAWVVFAVAVFSLSINIGNFISSIVALEVAFLAVNINFILYSKMWNNADGYLGVIVALTLSAIEFVVGIAIINKHYHKKNNISVALASEIKE